MFYSLNFFFQFHGFSCHCVNSGVPWNFFRGGGFNKFNCGQRTERTGIWERSPLVKGSGGSCKLVQEISFHIVKFSSFFGNCLWWQPIYLSLLMQKIANLGSFRILLPFFRTSWCVGVLNSATFNSFYKSGLSLERFWRAFGISGGGVQHPKPPHPRYATAVAVCWRNGDFVTSSDRRTVREKHDRSSITRLSLDGVWQEFSLNFCQLKKWRHKSSKSCFHQFFFGGGGPLLVKPQWSSYNDYPVRYCVSRINEISCCLRVCCACLCHSPYTLLPTRSSVRYCLPSMSRWVFNYFKLPQYHIRSGSV